jgi:RNA polymerase sigma factor (sigma-70 family)
VISAHKLSTLEGHRRRIWGLCYRMTGDHTAADDLSQESMARALQRAEEGRDDTFEGWMYRVATTTCLDWLRHRKREGASFTLVDPLDLAEQPFTGQGDAESRLLRREDLRLAVLSSMRALPPKQRAVLILRDILDRSTEETAEALGLSAGNVKVLLHRARARLEEAHRVAPGDAPVDSAVVERLALALEANDIAALTGLLAEEVWGLVDDGMGKRRPNVGIRAVSRQWANAMVKYGEVGARVVRTTLNGESSLVVLVADQPLASIHVETRAERVISLRVVLDPIRLARLGIGTSAREPGSAGEAGTRSDPLPRP